MAKTMPLPSPHYMIVRLEGKSGCTILHTSAGLEELATTVVHQHIHAKYMRERGVLVAVVFYVWTDASPDPQWHYLPLEMV